MQYTKPPLLKKAAPPPKREGCPTMAKQLTDRQQNVYNMIRDLIVQRGLWTHRSRNR